MDRERIERGAEHALEDIAYELHLTREALQRLATLFSPPTFAKLKLLDSKGNILMPAQLKVGQGFTAILQEFVVSGGPAIPNVGPVVYSSSDPTIATVDPTTGIGTAVAAGVATITGLDQGNSLTASDTVSDTAPVATVAQLVITPN